MKIISSITVKELREMADKMYGSLVKADIDTAKNVVIIDMDMHADGGGRVVAARFQAE